MTEFTRKISFQPAYDKRSATPSKNYGVHGVDLRFTLKGAEDGVAFCVFTNWMLPHVQAETDARPVTPDHTFLFHKPQPASVDGHWRISQYEGQTPTTGCDITGGDCYCNGSGLLAEDLFNLLVAEGEEAVWKKLEEIYESWKPT